MGRFYRHVLIEGNFPHHGAVAFGHFGKALYEVFKYLGVPAEDIGYNQPKSLPYKTENPFMLNLGAGSGPMNHAFDLKEEYKKEAAR